VGVKLISSTAYRSKKSSVFKKERKEKKGRKKEIAAGRD
jgi:hypothetical protein